MNTNKIDLDEFDLCDDDVLEELYYNIKKEREKRRLAAQIAAIKKMREAFNAVERAGLSIDWKNGSDHAWISCWQGFHYADRETREEIDPFAQECEEW